MAAYEAFWLAGWDTPPPDPTRRLYASKAIPWAEWKRQRAKKRREEEDLFLLLLEEV